MGTPLVCSIGVELWALVWVTVFNLWGRKWKPLAAWKRKDIEWESSEPCVHYIVFLAHLPLGASLQSPICNSELFSFPYSREGSSNLLVAAVRWHSAGEAKVVGGKDASAHWSFLHLGSLSLCRTKRPNRCGLCQEDHPHWGDRLR